MAAAAAGAWNFLDILKIAAPVVADLANNTDNRVLKGLAGAMTIAGAVAPQGGGGQASGGDAAAKTPTPAGPTPQTPFKPDMQGKTAAQQQQLTKAVNQQNAWLKDQQAPKAELLKVKGPTIPKASDPANQANITKAYLKGLGQSGAKLDNKGQIVKQSGQAYKKVGWDREARLKAMDPMRRQRMLAIDKAHIGGSKQGPVPPTAMKREETGSPREIYRRRTLATDPDEFLKKTEGKGDSNPYWSLGDTSEEDIEKLFDGFR